MGELDAGAYWVAGGVLAYVGYYFRRGLRGEAPVVTPAAFDGGPDDVVIIDFETTGLSAAQHEIVEIGAIRARRADLLAGASNFETFQALVRPRRKLPRHITELTGITQAMVDKDGVAIEDALAGLAAFVGGAPLVAYNARFDAAFLRAAAEKAGRRFDNEWICAMELAREAWPDRDSYKLAVLAAHVDAGDAHRALADCQRALVVYVAARQQIAG